MDIEKAKEVWKGLFDGLKFIIYNNYEDLGEELQNSYGEIGTYILNFIFGIKELLDKHPEIKEKLQENLLK